MRPTCVEPCAIMLGISKSAALTVAAIRDRREGGSHMKIIDVEPYYWSCSHWGMFEYTFWDMWIIPPSVVNDAARHFFITGHWD